jgi:hypothetical protein
MLQSSVVCNKIPVYCLTWKRLLFKRWETFSHSRCHWAVFFFGGTFFNLGWIIGYPSQNLSSFVNFYCKMPRIYLQNISVKIFNFHHSWPFFHLIRCYVISASWNSITKNLLKQPVTVHVKASYCHIAIVAMGYNYVFVERMLEAVSLSETSVISTWLRSTTYSFILVHMRTWSLMKKMFVNFSIVSIFRDSNTN